MADGILFEKRGIQAASIVTSSFKASGDAMARRYGFAGYRYVVIKHPLGSLTPQECEERAREAFADVLAVLGVTEAVAAQRPNERSAVP